MATTPLISSGVSGPLGVLHLPRLWQKVILSATGNLADGYDECGMGYDNMVLSALGLDKDATLAYLKENVPSYPEFEKWVLEQKGGSMSNSRLRACSSKASARVSKAFPGRNRTMTDITFATS